MNAPNQAGSFRSFAAVLGGYLVSMIGFTGVAVLLGSFTLASPRTIGFIAGAVSGLMGGWLVAGLAGRAAMSHAAALAGMIFAMGLLSASSASEPGYSRWYDLLSLLPICSLTLVGARLQTFSSPTVSRVVVALCLVSIVAMAAALWFYYRPTLGIG